MTLSVKIAIKRAIPRPNAGQKVAAMKAEDQSIKAKTMIKRIMIKVPLP